MISRILPKIMIFGCQNHHYQWFEMRPHYSHHPKTIHKKKIYILHIVYDDCTRLFILTCTYYYSATSVTRNEHINIHRSTHIHKPHTTHTHRVNVQ